MTNNKKTTDLINKSILWRGQLLHQVSLLEMGINMYLAYYFCGENEEKFIKIQTLIFGDERMNLSAKQQVFFAIASANDTEWYESYIPIRPKQEKKKAYTMNTDMVWAIEQRNIFAHRMLDVDAFITFKEREEGTVRFIRMKNEIEPIDYKQSDFDLLMETIFNLAKHIHKRTSTYSSSKSSREK